MHDFDDLEDKENLEKSSVKLKQKEAKLRSFLKDDKNLHRRKDREQVVGFGKGTDARAIAANNNSVKELSQKNADKAVAKDGSGAIFESGISVKNRNRTITNTVDLDFVNSREYKNKYNGITGNSSVDEGLYQQSKDALIHRNGTYQEDMYLVSVIDGKVKGKIKGKIAATKIDDAVEYSRSMNDAVKSEPRGTLISIHNHATNNPPTSKMVRWYFYTCFQEIIKLIVVMVDKRRIRTRGCSGYTDEGKDIVGAVVTVLFFNIEKSIHNLMDDVIERQIKPG